MEVKGIDFMEIPLLVTFSYVTMFSVFLYRLAQARRKLVERDEKILELEVRLKRFEQVSKS
jgi:hypothetical protein